MNIEDGRRDFIHKLARIAVTADMAVIQLAHYMNRCTKEFNLTKEERDFLVQQLVEETK